MSDIVTRFKELLLEALKDHQLGFEEELAVQIERQLRNEFGGEQCKVRKSGLRGEALRDEIRKRWNGKNAEEIIKDMGVSRATVYRAICYRRSI